MGDDEELRARIEAQTASRRAAAPPPTRNESGRNHQPGDAQAPRSLEPARPWLTNEQPQLDSDQPTEAVDDSDQTSSSEALPWSPQPASLPAGFELPTRADLPSRPLEPVRPWLRRAAKPAPVESAPNGPPADPAGSALEPVRPWLLPTAQPQAAEPATPVDAPNSPLQPARPWLRRPAQSGPDSAAPPVQSAAAPVAEPTIQEPPANVSASEPVDDDRSAVPPARVLQDHWARERDALIAERAALLAERETLLAQRAALSELREAPPDSDAGPGVRKRRWLGRRREAPIAAEQSATESDALGPRHAAVPGQVSAPEPEPVSPFESFRRTPAPAEVPINERTTEMDEDLAVEAGGQDDEQARTGWSRRTIGWLLAPAEQPERQDDPEPATAAEPEPEPEPVAAVEPEPAAVASEPEAVTQELPPWRLRPELEPAAPAQAAEPEPEPVAAPEPDPIPEAVAPAPDPVPVAAPHPVTAIEALPPWRLRPDVEPAAARATAASPEPEPAPTEPTREPVTVTEALPPWRLRPDVEPAAARVSLTKPVPESVSKTGPVAEPVAEQRQEPAAAVAQPDDKQAPGFDLPSRMAAANAAAMARALATEAYDFPEDDAGDAVGQRRRAPAAFVRPSGPRPTGIAREQEPADGSPLVTGSAFAKRNTAPAEVDDDKSAPAATRRRRVPVRGLIRMLIVVVIAGVIAVLLRTYVVAPYYIPSASMEPTLHGCTGCNNDHVLVDKLSYKMHSIHRGDVVVFNRPDTWQVSEKVIIKRVIGLPGDTLVARKGKVYVNGLELAEPYVDKACRSGTTSFSTPVTVPDDEVFVMGDNRCDSSDSRRFGPIPDSKVVGRAFMIVWPFGRLHWL